MYYARMAPQESEPINLSTPQQLPAPVRCATVDRFDAWCDAVARIEGRDCTRNDVHQDPAATWAYDRDFTPREFHQGFWQ